MDALGTDSSKPGRRSYVKEYMAAFAVCLSPMAMGSVHGYTSPTVEQLKLQFSLSDQQESLVTSLIFIGALSGGLIAGILADTLGRKLLILLNCFLYIAGWILIAAADGVGMVYSGRIITGIATGITSLATPIYIAETASPEIRGLLCACFVVFGDSGMICAYVLGSFIRWNILAILLLVIPSVQLVVMFWLPETPSWLIRRGRRVQAVNSLKWLRNHGENIEFECSDIVRAQASESKMAFRDFFDRSLLHPLGIIFGEAVVQQFCGNTPVLLNAATIFRSATDAINPNTAAILVGVCACSSSVVACVLMDRAGRQGLLLFSASIMAITLIIFDVFYYLKVTQHPSVSSLQWLPILCVIIFIFAYNVGFAAIPWVMMGEVFPSQARGLASSLITAMTWTMAFISAKSFIDIQNAVGSYGVFWIFSGVCVFAVVFVYFLVPETKGKTLEEVQEHFITKRLLPDVEKTASIKSKTKT